MFIGELLPSKTTDKIDESSYSKLSRLLNQRKHVIRAACESDKWRGELEIYSAEELLPNEIAAGFF